MRRAPFVRIFFFLLALTGLTPAFSFAAETCNRVVAIVNNQVITLYELNKTIKEMTGYSAEDLRLRNEQQFLEARRQILHRLIDERIAEEKIKELRINVTDRQIDAAIERIKTDNRMTHEDLVARLQADGLTYEKYRERIKGQIERSTLIEYEVRSKIIISEADIAKYYEQNEDHFGTGDKVRLASIFLVRKNPDDPRELDGLRKRGEEILTKLKGGADFTEMARRFSDGPGADEGGDLGSFQWDQLDAEAKRVLEGIPAGGYSDLILRQNGVQIIKVVEKQEGEKRPLEEVRGSIYDLLYRQEVDNRYNEWIKGLRESSYTKIIF
jgi:peptidyl-prolyl cis-trans isomerase SurA